MHHTEDTNLVVADFGMQAYKLLIVTLYIEITG